MRIKMLVTVLLAGLLSLSSFAANVSLSGPNAYMNTFALDGTTYLWGSPWGLADVKTVSSNAPTYELHPNYNTYVDAVASGNTNDIAYWTDSVNGGVTPGPDGNKVLEGITFFEAGITADLTNAVFNFTVDSGTDLNLTRFTAEAFIQVIDPLGNNVHDTIHSIAALGPVPMSLDITGFTNGTLQAGWRVKGKNANPADAASHGKVVVTLVDLYAESNDTFAPTPLGFEVSPTAISGTEMTMTALEALDNYAVEYQFSNTVAGTSSDWQSSRTWVDSGPSLPPTTNVVELMSDTNYVALDSNWEGFEGGTWLAKTPSTFVTVSSGVATVTPGSANEWNFYQTFGAGPAGNPALTPGQTYTFSIVSDNDTTVGTGSAVAFVKAFDSGWGFLGDEFQSVALSMDGSTTTISFTPVAGVYYQVGTFTTGTTSGSYDVSNPSLTTTNITAGSSGLTPDTEYFYTVRARDLSPLTNMTAWLTPAVAGTSTVFDVTAPTPDPMGFAVPPTALGDTAISMVASNAVDDLYGVEYLFTNVTTGASSGWQSSPTWLISGVELLNADFEAGTTNWVFENGGGDPGGATTTNISGNTRALAYVDGSTGGGGGYAVIWQQIDLAGSGLSGGDIVTLSADIRALAASLNGGGCELKMESWAGGSNLGADLVVPVTVTESWDNYSMDYTIASGADAVKVVLVTTTGWGGANADDSYYLFDNVLLGTGGDILSPGTEYTFMVKARDTSPASNETAWSAPASATTTGGVGPVTPYSIDSSEYVSGVGMVFTWEGTVGHTYDVLSTTNLVTGPWVVDPVAKDLLSSGGTMSATSMVDGAAIFFQITTQE